MVLFRLLMCCQWKQSNCDLRWLISFLVDLFWQCWLVSRKFERFQLFCFRLVFSWYSFAVNHQCVRFVHLAVCWTVNNSTCFVWSTRKTVFPLLSNDPLDYFSFHVFDVSNTAGNTINNTQHHIDHRWHECNQAKSQCYPLLNAVFNSFLRVRCRIFNWWNSNKFCSFKRPIDHSTVLLTKTNDSTFLPVHLTNELIRRI